jgi:hypothetical protein
MFFYTLLNFFTMTEFWDKPAEKSGKVLAAFLEGQPLDSPPRLILSLVLHQVVEDGTVPVKGRIPAEGEAA